MTGPDAALSYVFWHWKRPAIDAGSYEDRQRTFHAALLASPPEGFLFSLSSALSGAPWASGGRAAYQDRYLIRSSAALDTLDQAVRVGARQQSHDSAAAVAAGGTAGLYRPALGLPIITPGFAQWFAKPDGASYADVMALLQPLIVAGKSVLWMRRMVLGPTPEFCFESVSGEGIPPLFAPLTITLRPIWPIR